MASSESFPEVDWSCEHKDSAEKWRHLLQSEGILGKWEPFWQVRSFLECFLLKTGETLCKMEVSLIKREEISAISLQYSISAMWRRFPHSGATFYKVRSIL